MRTLIFLAILCSVAHADEDHDLDRIPTQVPDAPPATAGRRLDGRIYVDEAFAVGALRDASVAFPPPLPYEAQNRTSLDLSIRWRPSERVAITASDRVDVIERDGADAWSQRTVTNELREAYVSWEAIPHGYLELGRINLRNGAALGFSPADFFRPRTLVGQTSLDPSVLRVNRLGTAMVRAQAIWSGGSASIAYAPKLFEPSPLGAASLGIDPRFDATNATHRALAQASTTIGDLSAEALAYLEPGRSKLGIVLSRPIGSSVVAYAEWAGGFERDLIARATEYGRDTGTLPVDAMPPIPTPAARRFANDVSAGGSLVLGTAVTLNVEYHFHQSGLSRGDWNRWFSTGQRVPMAAAELWYLRGYAADQLEPATMHELFVRADWPKAFVDHLDINGVGFVDLLDGSVLTQVTASYDISDAWTAALSVAGNLGPARSERGSYPQAGTAIAELVRYF